MTGFSMLLAGMMAALLSLRLVWPSKQRAVRLTLTYALLPVWLLFIAQTYFQLFEIPLDPKIAGPVSSFLIGGSALIVFGWVLRTFVTDYRRATAERLARERSEA